APEAFRDRLEDPGYGLLESQRFGQDARDRVLGGEPALGELARRDVREDPVRVKDAAALVRRHRTIVQPDPRVVLSPDAVHDVELAVGREQGPVGPLDDVAVLRMDPVQPEALPPLVDLLWG